MDPARIPTPPAGGADATGAADAADLALALRLADAADALTLAAFRRTDLIVDTKPDLTPVTEADRGVERRLREILAAERPADDLLGEEEGGRDPSARPAGRAWVIDPIDGTKNFVRGVPVWATLIAVVDSGVVTVGVASAPALGRRWWAARGSGAWTTGPEDAQPRRLAVSAIDRLADASFSYSDPVGWPAGSLARVSAAAWRVRAYGDFWSHLLVAEGAVDVAAEPELSIWDVAALIPIVIEAGGRVTAFTGADPLVAPHEGALTTNARLHDEVRSLLG